MMTVKLKIVPKSGLGNIRPTGHMRLAKHLNEDRKHFWIKH